MFSQLQKWRWGLQGVMGLMMILLIRMVMQNIRIEGRLLKHVADAFFGSVMFMGLVYGTLLLGVVVCASVYRSRKRSGQYMLLLVLSLMTIGTGVCGFVFDVAFSAWVLPFLLLTICVWSVVVLRLTSDKALFFSIGVMALLMAVYVMPVGFGWENGYFISLETSTSSHSEVQPLGFVWFVALVGLWLYCLWVDAGRVRRPVPSVTPTAAPTVTPVVKQSKTQTEAHDDQPSI